ncbi:fumarylacetoacetate hydrolase family protein [Amycolatopsis sp. DSM 110486]|uniref:fumarylacetoacetate hydrolase family protein n=1 Tax=Amycolatopsis sp. DSM 110486 TaxID=2865832 RepID=UPI001C6A08A6|nr:fumarylacetoacetate hydrolase family protein [Amycolatopsis sp. DSM 110486]QYN19289.1 fumarylacetoacetate hydrolase family protein [Amycolatopsis sp. DSM 110486]
MRITRFEDARGTGIGALTDGGLRRLPWPRLDDLFAEPDPAAAVRAVDVRGLEPVGEHRLLAPTAQRCQLIATGGNYDDHVAEGGRTVTEPVFFPALWSSILGPGGEIVKPAEDTFLDYEVEFAVVIGKRVSKLTPETAMDAVFGYTVTNDVSAREVMAGNKLQIMLAKCLDTFWPVGPHLVTADEVPDPGRLKVTSSLNGQLRQSGSTSQLIFDVPTLLSKLTASITLHPGDIVTTGTPGGVGYFRTPPESMRPGDVITVEVEGVGALTNRVIAGW